MHVIVDQVDVEFRDLHGHAIGKCRNDVFQLMALRVCDAHQNVGIGTDMLRFIADWCVRRGIKIIELYDMSVRYNTAHNIYVRAGFVYASPMNRDMYATPAAVQKVLNTQTLGEVNFSGSS